jgi:hypothetical protein
MPRLVLEAGGEGHDDDQAQEIGELLLELKVHAQRAVEEAGAGAAVPSVSIALTAASKTSGQVVRPSSCRPEHDAALALHDDLDVLLGLQGVEVGVDTALADLVGHRLLTAFLKQIDHSDGFLSFNSVAGARAPQKK